MPSSNLNHARSGSLSIQSQNARSNGMMSPISGGNRFDGPRSPPNTSHVPCKFFRQGACQAGVACPFSHDLSVASETVCKYFAKGNCKFGPKCANIHMLPDGRRINYGKNGNLTIAAPSAVALGARVNLTAYHPPSNSALTNSFLRADAVPPYTATSPYPLGDERYSHQLGRQPSMENGLPTIDTTYTSNPTSTYGSPRDEDTNRFGLGLSPAAKGLSVLDAPLPASFDSNGISHAARYGPWPSSVPSKFGLESPSSSLNAAKDSRTSETLKLLHDSAFGSHLSPSAIGSGHEMNGFGSSPPTGSNVHGMNLGSEEYFGKKAMHSSSLRFAKPRLMSSSAPKIDRDWEAEFLFEEEYVPGALANEVLTPAEKARRGSTTNTLRGYDGTEGTESVPISTTKFGSPGTAASPSRFGTFFQRQRDEDGQDLGGSSHTSRSLKHVSAFGHVGSPLRNSSLASAITSDLHGDSSTGRPSSASRQGSNSGNESLSALTQQLQGTRLDDGPAGGSPHLHPNIARYSNGLGSIGKERERERGLERHVSSGSIGSSVTGRFTTPIDEEDPSFVFSMEEEEDPQVRARKRASGGHLGAASPLSSGWTYNTAPNGNNTRSGSGAVETVGGR
ncbi:zinc finger protein LEE1 [Podospora aff. communis PSN243]|uniref:Zinc finger protein LEE1 n=1 Tax=Podospora aff. communis PSN243 TaxID=3040156 RepID=A0AAV9GT65_9PEZI|nr:zinc finger protein LEE1 [Podospora aff. communis PSN243]